MYSGAQVSLYPMTSAFVPLIMSSLSALDPHREKLKIETDDLSTLLVGPPDVIFKAMTDLFVASTKSGEHVVLHATVSRGCPGEPDAEMCKPASSSMLSGDRKSVQERTQLAQAFIDSLPLSNQHVSAQFSYYPLGENKEYMSEIYSAIDFIKSSGTYAQSKNFCTKLQGDAVKVFGTLSQVFEAFAPEQAHVTLDVTVSANSPSKKN
jgi:uncharacterized protein YqgV (UPF0045/DUF77 family)